MRLIDLDEFAKLSQKHVADLSSLEEELDINYVWDMGYIECLKVLDSCHIIKAIPIEWIKKWCNIEHKSCEERLMLRYGVITMLEDWEKENENL